MSMILPVILFLVAVITYFISQKPTPSTFLSIMSGILFITAGISWIAVDSSLWSNIVVGLVFTGTGLYLMIMVGVDLLKGD
jgi:hypothetical protein